LAEDVAPFVAIGGGLRASGLAACEIYAQDLDTGALIVEDFGDTAFARALVDGCEQETLWSAAVDVLIELRRQPFATTLALPDGRTHTLPRFDRAALEIEVELILDWYWPAMTAKPASDAIRTEFRRLWSPLLDRMLAEPPGIFLRDFHSPNLFWRPQRRGSDRVGLIDYQDALAEPWAYDLLSILQDARVDVSVALERLEYDRYIAAVRDRDPNFDHADFAASYATFGAQRNTRLIGLWVRLLKRDGKPDYLQHMARTWDYLARNLAHPNVA
jgi:N-acetylmuramate 1-kinase